MDISFKNKRLPKKGMLLIADPFSRDNYFGRSIVYLCEHDKKGTFGFVINNYIDLNLGQLATNFPSNSSKVSIGGPVDTENIFFIHTVPNELSGSIPISDGIHIGGDYDLLLEKMNNGSIEKKQVRFFLGYSGWNPNQLMEEIDRNNWIVVPTLNPLEIMDTDIENLWQKLMKREGKKYELLANFPIDFNNN